MRSSSYAHGLPERRKTKGKPPEGEKKRKKGRPACLIQLPNLKEKLGERAAERALHLLQAHGKGRGFKAALDCALRG